METITIRIFYNDLKSIKNAEKKKTKLENLGYNLISHFGGMNESVMIYKK